MTSRREQKADVKKWGSFRIRPLCACPRALFSFDNFLARDEDFFWGS